MRVAGAHAAARIWSVELRPCSGGASLVCAHCTVHAASFSATSARSAALAHLARHALADALPVHLRTCQCRERGCSWHPRHRGCAGRILLALTRDRSGRTWRLADTCAACAAVTRHTAVVPDTLLRSQRPSVRRPDPVLVEAQAGSDAQLRVREMLTYLAAALPRFVSPAARLLALQCALRVNSRGQVRIPAGLLRGMRLHGRKELWAELEYADLLRTSSPGSSASEVQLLDAALLDQAPGRAARRRAAHWALHPVLERLPACSPPALQLITLALAAHMSSGICHRTDMEDLTRLSGQSRHQAAELLDRLVRTGILTSWRYDRDSDEVLWQPALTG